MYRNEAYDVAPFAKWFSEKGKEDCDVQYRFEKTAHRIEEEVREADGVFDLMMLGDVRKMLYMGRLVVGVERQ